MFIRLKVILITTIMRSNDTSIQDNNTEKSSLPNDDKSPPSDLDDEIPF